MVAMGRKSAIKHVVLCYLTNQVIYSGPSESEAVECWIRGTVYANGRTKAEAMEDALCLAFRARRARKASSALWVDMPLEPAPRLGSDPTPQEIAQACQRLRDRREAG